MLARPRLTLERLVIMWGGPQSPPPLLHPTDRAVECVRHITNRPVGVGGQESTKQGVLFSDIVTTWCTHIVTLAPA
jgi:hypothetical protein